MAGLICRNATYAVTLGGTEDGDLYLSLFVILVAHLRCLCGVYLMMLHILKYGSVFYFMINKISRNLETIQSKENNRRSSSIKTSNRVYY